MIKNDYSINHLMQKYNNLQANQIDEDLKKIVESFCMKPWISQEYIFDKINFKDKQYLKDLNKIIRENERLQFKITNSLSFILDKLIPKLPGSLKIF